MSKTIVIPVGKSIHADSFLGQVFTEGDEPAPVAFRAPIDMKPGDVCTVNLSDGTLCEITREGKTVWSVTYKRS